MPGLTPRADLTDTYKIIAIAFLLSACIYFQNSHYQPVAGDNLHRLPFGGQYQDGTKKISYFSQQQSYFHSGNKLNVLILILILTLGIVFTNKFSFSFSRTTHQHSCYNTHSATNNTQPLSGHH
uniref:TGBp2 n=1 Tax=Pepino mosaic virus TaxID=112229 RepID=A0A384ZRB0_9VIRU|nr:TGBp2 [Pepino mosaic virus]AXB54703.1 TGBp2 [Pepino mosaic virus]AXB54707.1 TGBp2 [Pepino mosaic virus]AXB54711.1 TGBp2 [Pepino mosaic virus]